MPEFCKFSSLSKYVNIKLIPYNWLNPLSLVDESKNWSYGQIPLVLVKIDCNQIKSFLLWTSKMDQIPHQVSQDSLSWSVWYQSDFKWNHSLPSLSPKRSLHWPWRNLPCPLIGKLYVIAINVHWNWSQMTTDGLQTGQFLLRVKKTRILVRSTSSEALRTIQFLNPARSESVRMVRKLYAKPEV